MSDNIKVYGIDLGTTYSCIAHVDEFGKPVILEDSSKHRTIPSAVFFESEKNIQVGEVAKERSKINPDEVVMLIKTQMGNKYEINMHGKNYRPEEISALILKKLVSYANDALGEDIKDVVITCPAYFGDSERKATRNAGTLAGLNVLSIINEPTAAALSYGMTGQKEKVILVYDLGGGTFDVTMLRVGNNSYEVIVTGGDSNLGGKDWDQTLYEYCMSALEKSGESRDELEENVDYVQELFLSCEKIKISLSSREKDTINIPGTRIKVDITREKFNELTEDKLNRTIMLTKKLIKDAEDKNVNSYDEIILVGGSSKMPQVSEALEKEFGVKPELFEPDECVAKGAALYAKNRACLKIVNKAFEEAGTTMEKATEEEKEKVYAQLSGDIGIREEELKKTVETKVVNVISKSFGVAAFVNDEKKISNLVIKQTPIPTQGSEKYCTRRDDQINVVVDVYENDSTGECEELDKGRKKDGGVLNLPPGLKAGELIDVYFNIDDQGMLLITARHEPSNQNLKIEVRAETEEIMTEEEVEKSKKTKMSGLNVI